LSVHNRTRQFFTNSIKAKPALVKDFRSNALFFTQNSEQQMLGANVPVIQALRLFGGIREDPLAFVRERQINGGRNLFTNGGSALNFLTDAFD
jgi:hypothetical protein